MTSDLALAASILFAVLVTAGYGLVAKPPTGPGSGRDVVAWAKRHRGRVMAQAWLVSIAFVPGLVLFALAARQIDDGALAGAFLVGGGLTAALTAVAVLLRLGLASEPSDLDPAAAQLVAALEAYVGPLLTVPVLLQAGALALAVDEGDFASWLLPFTVLLAAWQTAETATILARRGFFSPGAGMNQLGGLIWVVWLLALGVAIA